MWWVIRWLLAMLLQPGGVPRHVAFIMDGNRRFAARKSISKMQGHSQGYSKMVEAVHWCLELGVPFISVYAFSIDNFSRSLEEVETLMRLAEDKYNELASDDSVFAGQGVEIRVVGDLSLAPLSVQQSAARIMRTGAALPAKQAVLNICFSYTSSEELVHSIDVLSGGVTSGGLLPGDVTPELMMRCLRTQASPPVELMIRTSGETRLSDFLLWQCSHAQLEWVDCMWPDWGYLSFLACIISWQQHHTQCSQLNTTAQDRMQGCTALTCAPPTRDVRSGAVLPPHHVQQQRQTHAGQQVTEGLSLFSGLREQFLWCPPSNWSPHLFKWGRWVLWARQCWAALVVVLASWCRAAQCVGSGGGGCEGEQRQRGGDGSGVSSGRCKAGLLQEEEEQEADMSADQVEVRCAGRQAGAGDNSLDVSDDHVDPDVRTLVVSSGRDLQASCVAVASLRHVDAQQQELAAACVSPEHAGRLVGEAAMTSHLHVTSSQCSLSPSSSTAPHVVDLTTCSSPADDSELMSSGCDSEVVCSSEPASPHQTPVLLDAHWPGDCLCEVAQGGPMSGVVCAGSHGSVCEVTGLRHRLKGGSVEQGLAGKGVGGLVQVQGAADECAACESGADERQRVEARQARVMALLRAQQRLCDQWIAERAGVCDAVS